jgi:tetratricopeptide (TPR) repeat protein
VLERFAIPKRQIYLFIGGVFALLVLIYIRSLLVDDFVNWDDSLLIYENPFVQGLSLTNIFHAFTHFDPDLYVPFTFLSFQLNYVIGGLQPFIYHLTNLLLHGGSVLLVAWVVLQLSNNKYSAAIAALLFAVHPLNVDTVAWASARKDVLSSFFFLLSLGFYLRYREIGKGKWYGGSVVAYLAGLLSKVSILPLPMILLLSDWYRGRLAKKTALQTIPFFVLSIAFGVISIFGKMGGTRSLFAKLLLGAKATVFSLWHVIAPFNLSLIYPYTTEPTLTNPDILVSLAIVAVVTVVVLLLRKRWPGLLFAWLWFVLLLAPSFLTAEKGQDVLPELFLTSDRYVHLAAIAIFLLAGRVFVFVRHYSIQIATLVLGAGVLFLSFLAFLQTLLWQNTETLLNAAIGRNPESAIAHNNLGVYYESLGRSEEAFNQYLLAVQGGGTGDAWFNLGVSLMQQKKNVEAIQALKNAVVLRPAYALAQLNLGALLLDAGDIQGAVDHLLAAQALDPTNVTTYLNLGIALEKGNDTVDAIAAYQRALSLDPNNQYAQERVKILQK